MTWPFKPFDEMTAEDYADIGLMCGLEVHQQLLTERKLFCRCPAGCYSSEYEAEVLRHMRPTLSELGEYDGTALMEKKTRKNIYYRIHPDTVCTYEIDDTPPFFPDPKAIDIALEISLLCNLNTVGEMHIARKQYLDGSIPTGFQRTAILGVGGSIPYGDREIGIRQLSLEEDSCREVSDIGHDRICLTDRLGMPLIEVVTEPDMRTPQETAEVCQVVRLLCRGTGKVRTGYGATREDVNVSVRGGTRIEIKGVPQITRIPLLVYNEAMRQCGLLRIRDELKRRGVTPDTFVASSFDVTRTVAKTHYQPIRLGLDEGHRVRCVVLSGFAGLLNWTTQEHTTFAKEFSDRVRVIACLTTTPNIVHSDTASEMLIVRDWKELRRRTKAGEQDALILVWGDEEDARTACEEITIRAKEATEGIPSDTRQALKDGTNGFERVLPGAERMYPDTDLPPMAITEDRLDRIEAQLPPRVWDRIARYRALGIPADTIELLCVSPHAGLFERLVDGLGINPTFAAVVLVQRFKALRREGLGVDALLDADIYDVFRVYGEGRLGREAVVVLLARACLNRADPDFEGSPVAGELSAMACDPVSDGEVQAMVADELAALDDSLFATDGKKYRYVTGKLMARAFGRIDGRRLADAVALALGVKCDERRRQEVRV